MHADTTFLPILVTAANAPYARCLYQLLRSAERRGWSGHFAWIVYDMGLGARDRARLQRRFSWCEWRELDFDGLPDHVPPERGSYAWKPLIIATVAQEFRRFVVWLDSAAIVTGAPDAILRALEEHGLWVLRGQSSLQDRCEPAVLTALGVPGWLWGTREVVAGALGFDTAQPWIMALLERWRDLCLERDHVLPEKRTIKRHMFDQAVFSALVVQDLYSRLCPYPVWDIDISSPQPIRYLTSRNKVANWLPWLADPLARSWFRVYKTLDQAWLRFENRWSAFPHRSRRRREYYLTTIRNERGDQVLPSPTVRYFADPFLFAWDGRVVLFFEDLDFRTGTATISAAEIGQGRAGDVFAVLDPGSHTSFPYVFAFEGACFMVPELSQQRRVALYRCDRFPDRWSRQHDILTGVDAADTVIFEASGRWWLITSMRSPDSGGDYRYLAVFHAPRPDSGDWTPHPINREGLYITLGHGSGRNAGAPVVRDGRLFRPMQSSNRYYANGMKWMEIVTLSEDAYQEIPADAPPGLAGISATEGVHHVSVLDDMIAWDRRTRH